MPLRLFKAGRSATTKTTSGHVVSSRSRELLVSLAILVGSETILKKQTRSVDHAINEYARIAYLILAVLRVMKYSVS